MDYRIYHAINVFVVHHAWLGRSLALFEKWAVPVYAVAVVLLWLLARPRDDRKWKLASAAALSAAGLALLLNQLIAKVWHRRLNPAFVLALTGLALLVVGFLL
jgi:hypothetical protein